MRWFLIVALTGRDSSREASCCFLAVFIFSGPFSWTWLISKPAVKGKSWMLEIPQKANYSCSYTNVPSPSLCWANGESVRVVVVVVVVCQCLSRHGPATALLIDSARPDVFVPWRICRPRPFCRGLRRRWRGLKKPLTGHLRLLRWRRPGLRRWSQTRWFWRNSRSSRRHGGGAWSRLGLNDPAWLQDWAGESILGRGLGGISFATFLTDESVCALAWFVASCVKHTEAFTASGGSL